jgi:acetoacetyl-CoA synthetase
MTIKAPLWIPSEGRKNNSNLFTFMKYVKANFNVQIDNYDDLYNWSVTNIADFWKAIWEFGEFKYSKNYSIVVSGSEMNETKWFTGAKLNFAENLLRYRDSETALISVRENTTIATISYKELYQKVASCSQLLRSLGVEKGDRIAALITNTPEAVIGMLATASIGAIWSSCSPDFGLQGVVDRFGQIRPKILFAVDSYSYNGVVIDCCDKIRSISDAIPEIEMIIIIDQNYPQLSIKLNKSNKFLNYNKLNEFTYSSIDFEQVDFDYPIYIMYSSGTTGKPKCIVHGTGGTLLQHFKELRLHTDLKREDVITFYTTCGWMMWNWLISSLKVGASILLYDGSPVYPKISTLWDLIDEHQITIFGTSPKFLIINKEKKYIPKNHHDLQSLKTILSTGSPLTNDDFKWTYQNVKGDVLLSSISGGTDIISCFMLGNPLLPVYTEEIQCRGLGMKVEVYNENAESVVNEKGELVCTAPFPSMPVYFWNDPDNKKYRAAYFNYYSGVWRHGDYIMLNERGGLIVFGRSDSTLNPGGVRIGTAEIYNIVERIDEVSDSIVVGQNWKNDVRIVLFIVLKESLTLTQDFQEKIKSEIKRELSPRHVPSKIIQINEVPRTINLKKVEVAVSRLINNDSVDNKEVLINPDSLEQFKNLSALLVD